MNYLSGDLLNAYGGADKFLEYPISHAKKYHNGIIFSLSENPEDLEYSLKCVYNRIKDNIILKKMEFNPVEHEDEDEKYEPYYPHVVGNHCDFRILATGEKESVKALQNIIEQQDDKKLLYGYDIDDISMHKARNGNYTLDVSGVCSWSVYCCFCQGEGTYAEEHPDTATSLLEESGNLSLDIRVIGLNEDLTRERYHYKNGKTLKAIEDMYEDDDENLYTENGLIRMH